jgi:AhpD family alkylhydroperoxidase
MSTHTATNPQITDAYRSMLNLERYLSKSKIEKPLRELIKLRVSQINGCAFCIDMHWKDARADGQSEQRLYGLSAWQESPYYSDRERAALALAEDLTQLPNRVVSDASHELAREHFDDQEFDDLLWVIASINSWNRYSIGSRKTPGEYQPASLGH